MAINAVCFLGYYVVTRYTSWALMRCEPIEIIKWNASSMADRDNSNAYNWTVISAQIEKYLSYATKFNKRL